MKLEQCLKCEFHKNYKNGQVLCNYKNIMVSMATYANDKNSISVLSCPKDIQSFNYKESSKKKDNKMIYLSPIPSV
jgi:hypothetical protein